MLGCMASGETQGCDPAIWIPSCRGLTGLRASSNDTEEDPGCNACNGGDDDNFIAPLDMVAGRSYALLVNNFSRSGQGFSIEFGGQVHSKVPSPNFFLKSPEMQ